MTTIGNKFAQLGTSIINLVGTRASKNMDNLTSTGEANILEIVENAGISGKGSGHSIGEVVYSAIPISDACFHLLDGGLIYGDGIYNDFVTYMSTLYAADPTANYWTTETDWQSSVTTYGVCGKFVYTAGTADIHWYAHTVSGKSGVVYMKEEDANKYGEKIKLYSSDGTVAWSNLTKGWQGVLADGATYRSAMIEGDDSNGDSEEIDVGNLPVIKTITRTAANDIVITGQPATVRLPKITGILEGTTDISALGDLVEAGLPNVTGTTILTGVEDISAQGVFSAGGQNYGRNGGHENYTMTNTLNFSASRSNSIYGNSNTVQPQTIRAFYYIVIATSTKTDIQIDIDQVTTDLNNKVDRGDLQEVQCVVETYQNGASWYRIYSDGWCEQGGQAQIGSEGQTVVLLKNFVNTNYYVGANGLQTQRYVSCYTKTTSSFKVYTGDDESFNSSSICWQACGYIR